ncbi:MAG TPA: prenyltransferase/squalene oxidase repeat-containing protein [Planctomycetaceae bacterium]|nr:prenyltransferase/squalene oxidase repeat-containing protein [Planctomycetaceae bacterium]
MLTALAVSLSNDGSAASAAPRTAEQKQIDDAVARALEYLARQQRPSGAWATDPHGESTAATSLACMAFMAAGHVPGEGPYGDALVRGIDWVLAQQRPDGLLIARPGHGQPMYDHGITALMLAEVIGMLDKPRAARCRTALEDAVRLILRAQAVPKSSHHAGGWRYQPTSNDSDLSVTGWQLLALRAAKNVGCDVPADHIDRAVEYVRKCFQHGGFGYQPTQNATATRTGTGILCLEICGQHHTAEALAGAEYLARRPLGRHESYFFYGVYYCSVGMFQVGGKYWEQSKSELTRLLIPSQQPDGSWIAPHHTEARFGTVYSTSLGVLGLAVEYQYLPIYQR